VAISNLNIREVSVFKRLLTKKLTNFVEKWPTITKRDKRLILSIDSSDSFATIQEQLTDHSLVRPLNRVLQDARNTAAIEKYNEILEKISVTNIQDITELPENLKHLRELVILNLKKVINRLPGINDKQRNQWMELISQPNVRKGFQAIKQRMSSLKSYNISIVALNKAINDSYQKHLNFFEYPSPAEKNVQGHQTSWRRKVRLSGHRRNSLQSGVSKQAQTVPKVSTTVDEPLGLGAQRVSTKKVVQPTTTSKVNEIVDESPALDAQSVQIKEPTKASTTPKINESELPSDIASVDESLVEKPIQPESLSKQTHIPTAPPIPTIKTLNTKSQPKKKSFLDQIKQHKKPAIRSAKAQQLIESMCSMSTQGPENLQTQLIHQIQSADERTAEITAKLNMMKDKFMLVLLSLSPESIAVMQDYINRQMSQSTPEQRPILEDCQIISQEALALVQDPSALVTRLGESLDRWVNLEHVSNIALDQEDDWYEPEEIETMQEEKHYVTKQDDLIELAKLLPEIYKHQNIDLTWQNKFGDLLSQRDVTVSKAIKMDTTMELKTSEPDALSQLSEVSQKSIIPNPPIIDPNKKPLSVDKPKQVGRSDLLQSISNFKKSNLNNTKAHSPVQSLVKQITSWHEKDKLSTSFFQHIQQRRKAFSKEVIPIELEKQKLMFMLLASSESMIREEQKNMEASQYGKESLGPCQQIFTESLELLNDSQKLLEYLEHSIERWVETNDVDEYLFSVDQIQPMAELVEKICTTHQFDSPQVRVLQDILGQREDVLFLSNNPKPQ